MCGPFRSSSRTQAIDRERFILGGATAGLGSPAVRSPMDPSCTLMYPILRLSIPCGCAGHQSADLAPASRPQRHASGYHPYSGKRYRAGEHISTGFCGSPGQSGDQQALLQTSADAVNPMQGASSYGRSAHMCSMAIGRRQNQTLSCTHRIGECPSYGRG